MDISYESPPSAPKKTNKWWKRKKKPSHKSSSLAPEKTNKWWKRKKKPSHKSSSLAPEKKNKWWKRKKKTSHESPSSAPEKKNKWWKRKKKTSHESPSSAPETRNKLYESVDTYYESPPSAPRKGFSFFKTNRTSPKSPPLAPGNDTGRRLEKTKLQGEVTNEASYSFERKLLTMREIMKRKNKHKVKVGIFSRSAECEYEWLKTRLKSEYFVQPFCITNNGARQFAEAVSQCNFGILYHTQNRGRINITNVTDALYDEELEQLSMKLGKNNVIVVIDDLNDISKEKKDTILNHQPSLKELAKEVFLFSKDEKKNLKS